jgi:hypothetical protein
MLPHRLKHRPRRQVIVLNALARVSTVATAASAGANSAPTHSAMILSDKSAMTHATGTNIARVTRVPDSNTSRSDSMSRLAWSPDDNGSNTFEELIRCDLWQFTDAARPKL